MTSTYFRGLSTNDKERYTQKLYHGQVKLPDPLDTNNKELFSDIISLWPDIQWPDLYSYLNETPGPYTLGKLKAYKSLEAYNYFQSGHVKKIEVHACANVRMLRANVLPSQRQGELHPWVVADVTGEVLAAHCDCMAGLGEVCSHVAAVLFTVEAAVREGVTKPSATSLPCAWKKITKPVNVQPIHSISFIKPKRMRLEGKDAYTEAGVGIPEPKGSPTRLLKSLSAINHNRKIFTVTPCRELDDEATDTASEDGDEDSEDFVPIPLINLYGNRSASDIGSDDDLEMHVIATYDSLNITKAQARAIEECTRKQANSELWHLHRAGRITSTNFHDVRTMKATTSPNRLICTIMDYTVNFYPEIPSIKWGRQQEKTALSAFLELMKDTHTNVKCRDSGLVINPKWPYLGASPDGVVTCDCCGDSIVEIKCPAKYAYHPLQDALKDSAFYLDDKWNLKVTHKYYDQVQGQLAITGAQKCYFVVWTTLSLTVVPIRLDENFWGQLLPKLEQFYIECIVPELLTKRLSLKTASGEIAICFCGNALTSKIIACDNFRCDIVWYHLSCVGLSKKPGTKWLCENCSNLKSKPSTSMISQPSTSSSGDKLYCVCQQPEEGKMIACDGNTCKIEWFHFKCVNLTRKPRGKWYCKYCTCQ